MDIILVYVTHKDQNNANKINDHLFHHKLISGVHSFPIEHTYLRNNKIEISHEVVTIYATRQQNRQRIEEAIQSEHPNKVPCIVKLD